jgi:hypothetical protein
MFWDLVVYLAICVLLAALMTVLDKILIRYDSQRDESTKHKKGK